MKNIKNIAQKFFNFFLDIFFPLNCVVCKKNLEGEDICEKCLFQQKIYPKHVEFSGLKVSSFFLYSSSWVKDLIRKGKYKYSPEIFKILSFFIIEKINEISPDLLEEIIPANSVLVPVPLHYFRFQKRGYNQSQLIAESFVGSAGAKIIPLVQRIRSTPPQAKCSREERKKNLENAFSVDEKYAKKVNKDSSIVLIDDVVSTASTLLEIAKILKKSGFKNVSAVTLARGG